MSADRGAEQRRVEVGEGLKRYQHSYFALLQERRGLTKQTVELMRDKDSIYLSVELADEIRFPLPSALDTFLQTVFAPEYEIVQVHLDESGITLDANLTTEDAWTRQDALGEISFDLRDGKVTVSKGGHDTPSFNRSRQDYDAPIPVLNSTTEFVDLLRVNGTEIALNN